MIDIISLMKGLRRLFTVTNSCSIMKIDFSETFYTLHAVAVRIKEK